MAKNYKVIITTTRVLEVEATNKDEALSIAYDDGDVVDFDDIDIKIREIR